MLFAELLNNDKTQILSALDKSAYKKYFSLLRSVSAPATSSAAATAGTWHDKKHKLTDQTPSASRSLIREFGTNPALNQTHYFELLLHSSLLKYSKMKPLCSPSDCMFTNYPKSSFAQVTVFPVEISIFQENFQQQCFLSLVIFFSKYRKKLISLRKLHFWTSQQH